MNKDVVYTIDALIQKIIDSEKQYDLSKIISAYELAEKSHTGQTRDSGEPYITHPVAVAFILLELGMDTDTICAALLHDVVEDTEVTLEELKKMFGSVLPKPYWNWCGRPLRIPGMTICRCRITSYNVCYTKLLRLTLKLQ